ncbi:MAG TPA: hypothetical protein VNN07_03055, partial [Candidatus Tectomicrobia bacterium]|nr:hypothetical protein [Candidatus Tectomicrobia bacterium]
PAGFLADRRRHGAVRTYQLAFTLTDAIVVRAGFKGLLDYFTLFRESRDGGRNFERAFGVGLERFEADTWEALEGP